MPSFYQADFFRALLRTGKVNLKAIFTNRIPEDRVKLGWQNDLEGFEHEFLDEKHPARDAFSKALKHRRKINIVSGLWAGKVSETVLATLFLSHSRYFIYSEAPDPRERVSPVKQKILTGLGGPVVRNATGLLPISHFAYDYFKSYGAAESKLHPFGYFRNSPRTGTETLPPANKTTIDVVYVGQLVRRKGLDLLFAAMEPLFTDYGSLNLHLIGSGDMQSELEDWVRVRNLSGRIKFEGTLNPRQVTERISRADMLALPSRWDGWGLVVNEALMAGVPVIVSDMCGAADVVRNGVNGYIFRSEDVPDLRDKLKTFLTGQHPNLLLSEAAAETGMRLAPDNAAYYLLSVLESGYVDNYSTSKYPWMANNPLNLLPKR